jgi:hypothetical protein
MFFLSKSLYARGGFLRPEALRSKPGSKALKILFLYKKPFVLV